MTLCDFSSELWHLHCTAVTTDETRTTHINWPVIKALSQSHFPQLQDPSDWRETHWSFKLNAPLISLCLESHKYQHDCCCFKGGGRHSCSQLYPVTIPTQQFQIISSKLRDTPSCKAKSVTEFQSGTRVYVEPNIYYFLIANLQQFPA